MECSRAVRDNSGHGRILKLTETESSIYSAHRDPVQTKVCTIKYLQQIICSFDWHVVDKQLNSKQAPQIEILHILVLK